MQQPADILEENERLRVRLQQAEDVVRALRAGTVHAVVDQHAAADANPSCDSVLAQISDAVIAFDKADRITYLNAAAERLYGIAAADAMGRPQTDVFTSSSNSGDDEAALAEALREHGEWCGEIIYVGHDGRELDVECRITALKNNLGQPNGRVAVIRGVSKRRQQDQRVLVSEIRYGPLLEAARASDDRQAFLLKLSDTLRPIGDALEVQSAALRVLGEHLALNRAFFIEVDEDRDAYVIHRTYANGVAPLAGHFRLSEIRWTAELAGSGQTVVVDNASADPRLQQTERASYAAMEVAAAIGVPLIKDGRWVAALGVHQATPRHWTPEDIDLVRDVADRTWAAVERAKAETALLEREADLARVQRIGRVGGVNIVVAPKLRSQRSPEYLRLHGLPLTATDESHADWLARLLPEDREGAEQALLSALNGNAVSYECEYRIVRPSDGAVRWIEARADIERDANGSALRLVGAHADITEQKVLQQELEASVERQAFLLKFSDALRAEPNAEALTDRALQMLFDEMRLDRCYVGIYRLAKDIAEFPHQVYNDRLPPLPAQVRLSDFPKALQVAFDQTLVIDDLVKMDGLSDSERESFAGLGMSALIAATLRKGENNPLWAIVAVSATARVWTPGEVSLVEEVAERTWAAVKRARAKDRLQIAHDTFRNLIDRSPFGTYIIDADFRLIQISNGGQKSFANVRPLIGRDFAEVVRAIWMDTFSNEVIARFRHTLATGEPFKAVTKERRADSEATEAHDWMIERIFLPDGRPGVVCHFYDFTEKQQQEDRIRLLMGEVNHRAKNMLGLIQAIARQTAKTQPEHFLEVFGQRLQALSASQDLLVKSEWKAVQLGELIHSQLAHFGDDLDGRITIDGPLVQITASASQSLGMAVHELATNAAKFGALSNESGRVVISWGLHPDVTGQKLFAMSWVESGGPPVVKPVRHGFGSTVIDGMLRMSLGCDAEVDFAPTGLVWRIGCPAAGLIEGDVDPRPNGTAAGQDPAPVSGRRILVVEDEPLIAMDFSQTLSEAGYVVIGPANSVARALALLARFGCDAATLDVNLGTETSEAIARELIRLGKPFVATCGYSREQMPEIMQTAPLLGKPVSSAMLIAEVDRCLGRL